MPAGRPECGGMMKINGLRCLALFAAVSFGAVAAWAQTAEGPGLNLPTNPQFMGKDDPTVRKATAIVNGTVITATDIDQRLALYLLANKNQQIAPEELQLVRAQILRNLVDETLQIQAAEAADIKVTDKEV